MVNLLLRLKFRQGSGQRIAGLVVPGANVLADIAAKYIVPNAWAKFFRHGAAFLNRKIGNAQPRIELAGSGNRLRRACVNARVQLPQRFRKQQRQREAPAR